MASLKCAAPNLSFRVGAHLRLADPRPFLSSSSLDDVISCGPGVPGRAHRKDAFVAAGEQHPFQKPATLIVKEVFIPFVFHKLGYDHDDAASGMLLRKVENELNDGNDDEAVG